MFQNAKISPGGLFSLVKINLEPTTGEKDMILGPLKEDFTRENSPPQAKKNGFGIPKGGFYKGKWPAADEKIRFLYFGK